MFRHNNTAAHKIGPGLEENMLPVFPLGVYKDEEKGARLKNE